MDDQKYKLITDPTAPCLHVPSRKIGQPTNLITKEIAMAMIKFANLIPNACGMAAPQIGVNKKLIIVRHENQWVPMANARIIDHSDELIWGPEGCLSHPGVVADVGRWSWIRVVAEDIHTGKEFRLRFFHNNDLEAMGVYPQLYRILQHEIDHTDGNLFTDKVETKNYVISRTGMEKQIEAANERAEDGHGEDVDV